MFFHKEMKTKLNFLISSFDVSVATITKQDVLIQLFHICSMSRL